MIALVQVGPDDVRLDRLLQLYIFEWSARVAVPIGPDARYPYPELSDYADRDDHAAYLVVDGDRPVGFALAARDGAAVWHVEEFFVIHGARRRGVGADAARQLLASRPGRWTWTVRPENPEALAFWERVAPAAERTVEVGADGIARTRLTV